jgi:3-hydroxyisobutyrate dehydrogenase
MKIGVAGLGRMGSAIAKRLIEVGHEVVVWNRNQDKIKALAAAGAAVAATPSELAGRVETIITILTDAGAIASVYE